MDHQREDRRQTVCRGDGHYNSQASVYFTMCVDDTADSLYRYVYGLEWQKRGKNIEGKVYKLYSMNPKKMSAKQKRSAQNLDGVLKNLEDLSDKLDSIQTYMNE
nr:hypothetical protein [uncultured Prevotella sp.]